MSFSKKGVEQAAKDTLSAAGAMQAVAAAPTKPGESHTSDQLESVKAMKATGWRQEKGRPDSYSPPGAGKKAKK